jgi:hypothetical protein
VLGYREYAQIEERLKGDLDKARAEYHALSAQFHSLVNDIPSGLPLPNSELRIRQSGEAARAALQNYTLALKRFSQYTLSGIVPEDLLPMARSQTGP